MRLCVVVFVFSIFSFTSCTFKPVVPRSDALWNIISTQCLPAYKNGDADNPCIEVNTSPDEAHGYVVFKDRVGELQYLLMPTAKITGVESPAILADDASNYFDLAWKARSYMEKKYGSDIPVEAVSLAVNSQYGRSQNQLHIHISCPNPSIQKQIAAELPQLKNGWSLVPGGILGHQYYAKKISETDLKNKNAFKQLESGVPEAQGHMGEFGLAMVAVKNKKKETALVLLASRKDLLSNNWGSVEEIQDHNCPQLSKTK